MHVHAHPDDESSKGAASTAKYVAEGVDVHVATCTGGERGSVLNAEDGPPRGVGEHLRDPPRGDAPRARHPRHPPGLARLRRLRLARGRPAAPAARGLLRAGPARGGDRAPGAADPRLQAARAHDLRRARRLPPPRPHPLPRGLGRRLPRRRRPGPVPRRGGAVAAAQALLPPRLELGEDQRPARGDARARPGVAVRRAAGELGARARVGRPDHDAGAVRGVLRRARPGAAGPRDADRPRRHAGSPSRARSSRRSGPPRTTSSSTPTSRARAPRTTSSPASRPPLLDRRVGHWSHAGPADHPARATRRPSPPRSRPARWASRCGSS